MNDADATKRIRETADELARRFGVAVPEDLVQTQGSWKERARKQQRALVKFLEDLADSTFSVE